MENFPKIPNGDPSSIIQWKLDQLHKLVSNQEISEEAYAIELDTLWEGLAKEKLGRRVDRRGLGEFGLELLRNARKERELAEWWFENYAHSHFSFVKYSCIGVDQSGRIILDDPNMSNADYLLDNGVKLEIKTNPSKKKCTYKVSNLKDYIKDGVHVLTIHPGFYTLLEPTVLDKILKESTITKRWEVGGKAAIQMYYGDKPQNIGPALPFSQFGEIYKCIR